MNRFTPPVKPKYHSHFQKSMLLEVFFDIGKGFCRLAQLCPPLFVQCDQVKSKKIFTYFHETTLQHT